MLSADASMQSPRNYSTCFSLHVEAKRSTSKCYQVVDRRLMHVSWTLMKLYSLSDSRLWIKGAMIPGHASVIDQLELYARSVS